MLRIQNSKDINIREILTNVFKILDKNPVKESFYEKRKKIINVLTVFFISHKSDIRTFLK